MSKMNSLDWSVVQSSLVDLAKGQPGVTSELVFNTVKSTLGLEDKDKSSFQAALSAAMRDGRVSGFAGRRGKGGGLFPSDKLPSKSVGPAEGPKVVQLGGSLTMKVKKSGVTLKNGDDVISTSSLGSALSKASEVLASEGMESLADKITDLNVSLAEKQATVARLLEEKIGSVV
jgi:hypothetical protein